MNCHDIKQELSAYIDGEVTDSMRAEIEAHIASCSDCWKRLVELNKLAVGIAEIPKPQSAQEFLSAVRRKVAAADAPRRKTWADLLFRPAWLKVPMEALALIAILVTATILIRPAKRPVETPPTMTINSEEGTISKDKEHTEVKALNAPAAAAPVPASVGLTSRAIEAPPAAPAGESATIRRTESNGGAQVARPASLQGQAAQVDRLAMLTGDESMVVLDFDRPSELITVKSDDAASVRDWAQAVAASLGGRVIVTEKAADRLGNVYVILPRGSVEAFKSQFAVMQTLTKNRQNHSPGLVAGGSTFAGGLGSQSNSPRTYFATENTDMVDMVYFSGKAAAPVAGAVGGLADGTAGNSDSNVVLEIQVIPAKP